MSRNDKFTINKSGILTGYSGNDSIVIIPDGVTQIAPYSFAMSESIKHVYCLESLLIISEGAFERCTELISIQFGSRICSIGEGAFFECFQLKLISIPAALTFIDHWAFTSCQNLESIDVDINNPVFSSLNGVLFNKDYSTLITFPNKNSHNYSIPESVIKIRSDAFFRCNSIVSIQINSKISSLNFELFEGCNALTRIDVNPNNRFFTSFHGALFSIDLTRLIFLPGNLLNRLSVPKQTISIECSNSDNSLLSLRLSVENNPNFAVKKKQFSR